LIHSWTYGLQDSDLTVIAMACMIDFLQVFFTVYHFYASFTHLVKLVYIH